MENIDWGSIEAKDPGASREDLPGGAYVCVITGAREIITKKGKTGVEIVWDVAEGPHAGYFSDPFWHDKDYAHADMLLADEKSLPYTKRKLEKIRDSNSQPPETFDAFSAFGKPQFFAGRKVGLLIGQVVRTSKSGRDYNSVEVVRYLTLDEARSGAFKAPEPRDGRETRTAAANEDIPF